MRQNPKIAQEQDETQSKSAQTKNVWTVFLHDRQFFLQLLGSYLIIIFACIIGMGGLSYSFIENNLEQMELKANDRLLLQMKTTIDSLLLDNIDVLSRTMFQDSVTNPALKQYFKSDIHDDIYGLVDVMQYFDTLKSLNPMIYTAGIYYEKSELLITTEGVKSPHYGIMANRNYYDYYRALMKRSDDAVFWSASARYSELTADTTNDFVVQSALRTAPPVHVLHLVRQVYQNGKYVGSVILTVDESMFYAAMRRSSAQSLETIMITDEYGNIASHTDKTEVGSNIQYKAFGKNILHSKEKSGSEVLTLSGVPCAVSFSISDYNHWKYISITPLDKINAYQSFLPQTIVWVAIVILLVGILLAVIPSSRLSGPISGLVRFCKTLNTNEAHSGETNYEYVRSTLEALNASHSKRFEEILPVLKETIMRDIIAGERIVTDDLEARMRLIEFEFPFKKFRCIVIAPNDGHTVIDSEVVNRVLFTPTTLNVYLRGNGQMTVLINYEVEEKTIHEMLQRLICESNTRILIGAGEMVHSLENVNMSYRNAVEALYNHYLAPETQLLQASAFPQADAGNVADLQPLVDNLKTALNAQNRVAGQEALQSLVAMLCNGQYGYRVAKEILRTETMVMIHFAAKMEIAMDSEEALLTQFYGIHSVHEYEQWAGNLLQKINDELSSLHSDVNRDIVQKAKDCIEKNIKESRLSLQMISGELYVSPSHLSKIFKSETGITFIDYVIDKKLELSRKLLLTTDKKVEDISTEAGYSTSQYFISRFKRTYGFTPKEYRRRFSKNDMPDAKK
ncbi:MAG: AraC family transcriptional regulator [Ruthenibacterium sp.]